MINLDIFYLAYLGFKIAIPFSEKKKQILRTIVCFLVMTALDSTNTTKVPIKLS